MIRFKKNYPLKNLTSIKIGGKARFFCAVKTEKELYEAIREANKRKTKWTVIGDGSNLIVPDSGYHGLVIQNRIEKFELPSIFKKGGKGELLIKVGAGNDLLKTIKKLNRLGLAGMEKMAGIPGSVGGAVYGSAGAYGQEIKDVLTRIRVFDGRRFRAVSKKQAKFSYRSSIFKNNRDWIITEVELKLKKGAPKKLKKISEKIVKLRAVKYKPGLKCPGSFFKNIKIEDIPSSRRQKFLKKIPKDQIKYGKVPAGYLLETVGARGLRQNSVQVAGHHGNLIYNPNGGSARDVKKLASRLKNLVKNKFGIIIEEEVQYL